MGVLDALAISLAAQCAKKAYFEASATNAQCLRQDPVVFRRSLGLPSPSSWRFLSLGLLISDRRREAPEPQILPSHKNRIQFGRRFLKVSISSSMFLAPFIKQRQTTPNNDTLSNSYDPATLPQAGNVYPPVTRSSAFAGILAVGILLAASAPLAGYSIPETAEVENLAQLITPRPSNSIVDDGRKSSLAPANAATPTMPTPTPTPMATPWVDAGLGVGEVVADVPVGEDEDVVVTSELLVELLTLAV
jgi:hypothetical protein